MNATATPSQENQTAQAFEADDIERVMFTDPQSEQVGDYFGKCVQVLGEENILSNFEDAPADGMALLFIPIAERTQVGEDKDGNGIFKRVNKQLAVTQVPTLDMLLDVNIAGAKGREYVEQLLEASLAGKIANDVRRSQSNGSALNLPVNLNDFIETRRATGDDMSAFTALAAPIIEFIRQQTNMRLSKSNLRSALASSAFASSMFNKAEEQGFFDRILEVAVKMCASNKDPKTGVASPLDPSIFVKWQNERKERTIENKAEVDFASVEFGALIADTQDAS